jgi:transcriptional regulator with XRE-family HTH domain
MPKAQVGKRLQLLRNKAELSITELGRRAGVSAGMISQVERGLTNPSIKTLDRLRIALSVPLTALFDEESPVAHSTDQPDFVRKAGDRRSFPVGRQGLIKELLTPAGQHELQVMIIRIPGHAADKEMLMGEGEKAGLVLKGRISLEVDGKIAELAEGDSFQFSSMQSHSFRNPDNHEAQILWIMAVRSTPAHF